jgi:ABC-type multidrug transport system fused ATPase/permease subunit
LTNVFLYAGQGSSLALVGPTGAGKSTLADVILGVLKPDAGRVTIGGLTPIEAVTHWPGAIAYVPQEVAMVNGSIRENVALGLPVEIIDDSRVWEALDRGQTHACSGLLAERTIQPYSVWCRRNEMSRGWPLSHRYLQFFNASL